MGDLARPGNSERGRTPVSSTFIHLLRATNESLGDHLDRISRRELPPTLMELQSLSDSIEQVGKAWRSTRNHDRTLEADIARYAENLRRLKSLLERLQPQLEQRRAELHAGLTKLEAARRWAATLKQTR